MDIKNLPITKLNLNKLPFKNLVIICLAVVCITSITKCSINDIELSKTNEDWKFRLSATQQVFTKKLLEDSSIIATQQQRIFSEEEAKTLALIENQRLKKIKSVVKVNTVTKVEKVFVPFSDGMGSGNINAGLPIMDEDSEDDYEQNYYTEDTVKYFETGNEWYSINGSVTPKGVMFDSIMFQNKFTTTIGKEKHKGLNKILKKSNSVVEIKSENPYTDISSMDNIIIKDKKKLYQTTGFKIGLGVLIGVLLVK